MPKQIEEHIGDRLLAAIKAKGISQADVARRFKVAGATVSSDWIKHGRIAKKHIAGLVDYFGFPYEYWLGSASAGTTNSPATITSEQRQILALMEGMGTEALEALQKVTSLLLQSKPSSPPRSTRGRIIPDAPVQFPPLKNATTSKRRESDG